MDDVIAGRGTGGVPRTIAWTLWGVALVLVAAALVLSALNGPQQHAVDRGVIALLGLIAMVYVSIGGLIGRSRPENPIGWLLSSIGVVMGLVIVADQYGFRGLVAAPGSLPAVKVAASLGSGGQDFIVGTLLIVVLLFPDGRPLSRRWRPVVWVAVAVDAVGTLVFQLYRSDITGVTNSLVDHHANFTNALGILGPHGLPSIVLGVAGVLGIFTALAAIIGLFLRRRRGSPELRQQLAWLGYVGVIAVAAFVLAIPLGNGISWLATLIWSVLFLDILMGIPIACGIAVLRYHVYDLDVVVKKTVVFGALVALFTAVYAAVVIGIGAAIGHRGNTALTFAGAALAAILFQPARVRVRRFADRVVYGERATPTSCSRSSRDGWPAPIPRRTSSLAWPRSWRQAPGHRPRACGSAWATSFGPRRHGRSSSNQPTPFPCGTARSLHRSTASMPSRSATRATCWARSR